MPGSLNDTTTHALERPEEGWVPGSARPALIVVSAPDPEQLGVRVGLDPGAHVVGRSDPASLLVRDEAMSRRHFALEIDASGSVRIRDFGSRNGTFVNGERVDGARPLEGGVVRAGKTLFVWDTPVTKARLPRLADGVGEAIEEVVGWSLAAQALRDSVATVARPGGAVLVLGPTGTGKEVTARAIHAHSDRDGPFVAVNCAAIPDALAESELFGHVQGAFTGATTHRSGAFREADGGTLFLDEVGELSPAVQAKLLRVLEDRKVRPLGGDAPPREVDVRVVAATCANLDEAQGFRVDLRARLSDWVLHIPPLSQRRADTLALVRHFCRAEGREDVDWPLEMKEALLAYAWPLNVREVQRLVRRLLALTPRGGVVEPDALPEPLQELLRDGEPPPAAPKTSEPSPSAAELSAALREVQGNVRLLSDQKGWHRSQIYRWLKRFELDLSDFR